MDVRYKRFLLNQASMTFFWIMGLTELYIGMWHIIPSYFQNGVIKASMYCASCFVAFQCFSNWTGVRLSSLNLLGNTKMLLPAHGTKPYSPPNGTPFYYYWRHCYICKLDVPPRSHHCNVCESCIIQQDHHCFFTGVCIGKANQHHFVFFTFYMVIASIVGFYFMVWYIMVTLPEHISFFQLILPCPVYLWGKGTLTSIQFLVSIHLHCLFSCAGLCLYFFIKQLYLISKNLTSFELSNNLKAFSKNENAWDNLREALGTNWALNFLLPHVYRRSLWRFKSKQTSHPPWGLIKV